MTTTLMAKLAFISLALMTVLNSMAQTGKLQEEKELEVVNFKSIKKVLEQDGLSKEAQEKKKQVVEMKKVQNVVEASRYMYPTQEEMWSFLSEYWLIKNAQILGWDFEKPDYGLEKSFKTMLEGMGFYQKKFKILLLNSPTTVRASLPTSNNEFIAIISVPFIRSLDLSKLEISLLLLEDFFRNEAGYFKDAVASEKFKKLAGTNFQAAGVDLSMIQEMMKNYDRQINQKGFTFQQQFEITKKMDAFLKANPELWNGYFRMLGKIDRFVKANNQYKDYIRLYPSPEMQVKWLSPEEKAL
jgi:hypothetical protein